MRMRKLLKDICQSDKAGTVKIMIDNQFAIPIANNTNGHGRVKHMDIKYHFIREALMNGYVCLEYCPTAEMAADILTKPTTREKFLKMLQKLGLIG